MSFFKKITKIKITLAILILAVIAFGIYNLLWLQHAKRFEPFIEALEKLETAEKSATDNQTYRDYSGTGYSYQISEPGYLNFGGYLSVLTSSEIDIIDGESFYISEYRLMLGYWPRSGRLVLSISDLTESEGLNSHSLGSAVDINGTPLGRHPNDSEQFYAEWLSLHEKFNEPIMDMFDTVKELFGEDAFR